MKLYYLFFLLALQACDQNRNTANTLADTSTYITSDTIPVFRKKVSLKEVASYSIPVDDPAYHWRFAATVYETSQTFRYLLKLQYKAMVVTDTLKLPNFGTWPQPEIHKGKDPLTCIIGFLDKKKEFKEYKMVTAKDDKLKIIILKSYYTATYKI